MDSSELIAVGSTDNSPANELTLFRTTCDQIREEMRDSPYIIETMRVLPVGGYRSAIGSFWNAVVDDLRNKILHRSIKLFNKEMNPKKTVSCYEDFQDNVNDEMLIDGAYKLGVISWEAHKILKQAKETRHVFYGHPRSSEPGAIKVLAMMEDCIKYVLSEEYPPQIIDIDEYIDVMGTEDFYRNEFSVTSAIEDLPDVYKRELINRFFSSYILDNCSSILRSNIEYVAPFLWKVLPKETVLQIAKSVDKEVVSGHKQKIDYALAFIDIVGAKKYLSTNTRRTYLKPIIDSLNQNVDVFATENECVRQLSKYAGYIPRDLLYDYVNGLTQTYVGHIGGSAMYSRTDFYANGAAMKIPEMFETFDDESANAFVEVIQNNKMLKDRIRSAVKLRRLRNLGTIVSKRVSNNFSNKAFLDMLIDETKEREFFGLIGYSRK
ncbi:hypothetical protein LJC60_08710 [Ruminococcaceae bacterium OttesenSCG-928-D13]|nr:hypothetical protein [Ruminococcaceae bacterium OttesenSCG-928-D13]